MPDIEVTLQYIKDLPKYSTEKPFTLSDEKYQDGVTSNVEREDHPVTIRDVRGRESDFNYETHSFRFLKYSTQHELDGTDETSFRYLEEMRLFLIDEFSAEDVICYDIRRRHSNPPKEEDTDSLGALQTPAPPVFAVHCDHTLNGGFNRMRRHLTKEEAEKYIGPGYRARIVNTWRPLGPVNNNPLTVADYRTVSPQDLLATDQVNKTWLGEIYSLKHNPNHQFYWMDDMQPDEMCVMVMFDSHHGRAETDFHGCAHATFINPLSSAHHPARESVEIRAIVLNKLGDA